MQNSLLAEQRWSKKMKKQELNSFPYDDEPSVENERTTIPPIIDKALNLTRDYYLKGNPETTPADRLLRIMLAACEVGHDKWPDQIREVVSGKDVVDVGCGTTFYGAAMRAIGARTYTGYEPRLDMDRTNFRSRIEKKFVDVGVSLNEIIEVIPELFYKNHFLETGSANFDLAVMHTVTEHLMDIEEVFSTIHSVLRPSGEIWFLHHNFYSWSGHHEAPHSPKFIDPEDENQESFVDWMHVSNTFPDSHKINTYLNKIRLDDLYSLTSNFFEITEWNEIKDQKSVLRRLTPEIENRLQSLNLSRRDATTLHVMCRARRR